VKFLIVNSLGETTTTKKAEYFLFSLLKIKYYGKNRNYKKSRKSGGCCDGSAPMVFEKDDMYLDDSDILLGALLGVNFYMNQDQFEYWKHTHLTVDITEGRGSSFSLEIPLGVRFLINSRLLTEEENKVLNKQE